MGRAGPTGYRSPGLAGAGRVRWGVHMPDILMRCSETGKPVETGLDTETVVFETLPNVALPVKCPHCRQVHFWKPTEAWLARDAGRQRN
jgi:hypothetical protein